MNPEAKPGTRVAYFSMEIALESGIPTYSGGLGVLAGDTLRAAADTGAPMVGVTLLYRQGFFRQQLDPEGRQSELPAVWEPARRLHRLDARVTLELNDRQVTIGAWRYLITGSRGDTLPVYLLDTDLPENDPQDRQLTGQLYGGDQRYRLRQECLLGLGGRAMLRALGYDAIETYHMNEGHCALLALDLLEEQLAGREALEPTEEDYAAIRARCVFTTHTPVPAGHDRFDLGLVRSVLGDERGAAIEKLPPVSGGILNMTYLALFFARFINGVAQRHGEVAQGMYPGYSIKSITNGVHAATWASPPIATLFDRFILDWRTDNDYLRQALLIPPERLLDAHLQAKKDLMEEIARRTGKHLDPSVMTIGFARRAAAYKRADLIFTDIDQLKEIVRESGPLQFVFAGKAHPADEAGKEIIQRVFEASDLLGEDLPVVYLENHDMELGRYLYAGVDLWLNNPQKPMEASGTSGMKAALNGVPSLSVLDGWWPEGWIEGVTGWSIGNGATSTLTESDSNEELTSLYSKLRFVIVPLFYGSPLGYARIMRSTIAINGSYFSAQRMIEQYLVNAYALKPGSPSRNA
jgi:starch phosphorylase